LVLKSILIKAALEDRMQKYLIPTHPFLLAYLQTLRKKIFGVGFKVLINFQRFGLDVLHQFELGVRGPWSVMVYHFVEDEPDCPDVAFGGVGFGLEDLQGHVERRAY
jgi:hypothetical protein